MKDGLAASLIESSGERTFSRSSDYPSLRAVMIKVLREHSETSNNEFENQIWPEQKSLDLLQVCSIRPSNRSIYGSSWLRHVGMTDPGTTEEGTVRRTDGVDLGPV